MIRALVGTTAYIRHVFIQDTASTKGKGYAGITGGQCSLSYIRVGASAPVAVAVTDITTLGTFVGSATAAAIKAVATAGVPNPVGAYELHLPNNAFAIGAREVSFFLSDIGGSDAWAMLPIGIQLVADDPSTRLFDVSTLTMTVVSSIGKRLLDALDTNIASRLSPDGTLDRVTVADTVSGGVVVTTNNDKTGYSIATGGLDAMGATAAFMERAADTTLRRDWTAITAEPALRSLWNAARFLRNAWTTTEIAGRIVIKRENDVTTAWDANLGTDAAAVPIVSNDPTT